MESRAQRCKRFNAAMPQQLTRSQSYQCLTPYAHDGDKAIKRVVLVGMGCSAVVGDLLNLYLFSQRTGTDFRVINDYRLEWYCPDHVVDDPHTVFVFCSYSGSSREPLIAYDFLHPRTPNIAVWSSGKGGDELEKRALADGRAVYKWDLAEEDPEYPLFSALEFFASSTSIAREMGLLPRAATEPLADVSAFVQRYRTASDAKDFAQQLLGRDLLLLADPVWDDSIVKLLKMYFNEIAMVNVASNLIHEFTHSQIAAIGVTARPLAIVILKTPDAHPFEAERIAAIRTLLADCPSAENIEIHDFAIDGATLLDASFAIIHYFAMVAAHLAELDEKTSYELISRASGNPWYNRASIESRKTGEHD